MVTFHPALPSPADLIKNSVATVVATEDWVGKERTLGTRLPCRFLSQTRRINKSGV